MEENETTESASADKSGLPNQQQIDEWKKASPDSEIFHVIADEKTYYFRRPTRPEFKIYADDVIRSRYDAMMRLITMCMLFPKLQEFQACVEKKPALVTVLASELDEVFGTNIGVTVKKM